MPTPRLGAPELATSQTNKEESVNEAIRYVETGAGHFTFKDRDLAAPPGAPADGDCYLVAASPTGAWAGHAGDIAVRVNTAWAFIEVAEGFAAWVNDEDAFIGYDGSAWVTLAPSEATAAEVRAGAATAKYVSPDKMFDAAATVALSESAGNVAVDMSAGFNFTLAMTGNWTLSNPANEKVGQSGLIRIVQDATGSRTLAYGSEWKFAAGADPALSTPPNSVDLLFYQVIASGEIYANLVKAIA